MYRDMGVMGVFPCIIRGFSSQLLNGFINTVQHFISISKNLVTDISAMQFGYQDHKRFLEGLI